MKTFLLCITLFIWLCIMAVYSDKESAQNRLESNTQNYTIIEHAVLIDKERKGSKPANFDFKMTFAINGDLNNKVTVIPNNYSINFLGYREEWKYYMIGDTYWVSYNSKKMNLIEMR